VQSACSDARPGSSSQSEWPVGTFVFALSFVHSSTFPCSSFIAVFHLVSPFYHTLPFLPFAHHSIAVSFQSTSLTTPLCSSFTNGFPQPFVNPSIPSRSSRSSVVFEFLLSSLHFRAFESVLGSSFTRLLLHYLSFQSPIYNFCSSFNGYWTRTSGSFSLQIPATRHGRNCSRSLPGWASMWRRSTFTLLRW
jgi:hypothetical protein